jgi:hypothetical protein
MKRKTSSFTAVGNDGRTYTVDVWTTMVQHQGRELPGSSEHLLANGDELFDVPGKNGQWEIASTGVVISRA